MGLGLLHNATLFRAAPYFERVRYWVDKQQMLLVALEDLARFRNDYTASQRNAPTYDRDPRILMPDPRARHRLALAVESVCSCVYAMTEIAANFANYLTGAGNPEGQLPGSFNRLKKDLRAGRFPKLAALIGDMSWHDKLHAMRTEWTHFSTIFIGHDKTQEPIVVGAALRSPADKAVLTSRFEFTLDEIRQLARAGVSSLDGFAEYLVPLAIAKIDLAAELIVPVEDENRMPVFTEDHRFKVRTITARTQLQDLGLGDYLPAPDASRASKEG